MQSLSSARISPLRIKVRDVYQSYFSTWVYMTNRVKNFLLELLAKQLFKSKYFWDNFFINNRNLLLKEAYTYPSIVNNGYLHIERCIYLCRALNLLKKRGIVVDAGAANGVISIMLAEKFANSIIYAFEPVNSTFEELKKNIGNRKSIRVFNCGLGNSVEKKEIHLAHRITSSSLFEFNKQIKDEFLAQSVAKIGSQMIEINTLDNLLPPNEDVLLIKLDVQGHELEILKGAEKTLKRTAVIITEMQNHDLYLGAPQYFEIDNFLAKHGFVLHDIVPSIRKNNKLYEWDAIYVNRRISRKINS